MVIKIMHDKFGNTATIEKMMLKPYRDATHMETGYVLSVTSDYDGGFMHYRSVFDSEESAINKLNKFSCGTFK